VPFRFRERELRVTRNQTGELVHYLIEDPVRGVQHRLYEVELEVAQLLDGKRSAEKVAKQINKKRNLSLTEVDVESFATQLLALGFVERV